MITILVVMALGQFKEGDIVYIKNDRTKGYLTDRLARIRYEEPYGKSVSASQAYRDISKGGGQKPTVIWPKYSKLKVLDIVKAEGDTVIRTQHIDWKDAYWFHAEDLGPWSEDIAKKAETDKSDQDAKARLVMWENKLKPYMRNKADLEAVRIAVLKGFDPTNISSEQAKELTSSQRRNLNNIKQRFRLGK